MNYDGFADIGRRIARSNPEIDGLTPVPGGSGPPVAVAARWLVRIALALVAAWLVAYGVPSFGGLLAATVLGFVGLWAVPWLVVRGVVRVLESAE